MKIATVTKRFKFDSAHMLPGHPRCGKVHGHTWHVDVSVTGVVNPETGMVIDYNEIDHYAGKIIRGLDHAYLNNIIKEIPTCENIAHWLKESIVFPLGVDHTVRFVRIRVQEGEGGWAEV